MARGEVNQLPWWFTTWRRSDPIGWNAIQAEVFLTLGIDPCGLSWGTGRSNRQRSGFRVSCSVRVDRSLILRCGSRVVSWTGEN